MHDLRHQANLLREALQSEKRRLGFFIGAGCPIGIYDADGKKTLNHIPDVAGLTSSVDAALVGDQKTAWAKLVLACKGPTIPVPNVEHVLTQLRTICSLKGSATVDGMTAGELLKLDEKICELIVATVGKPLPLHQSAYQRFADWIRDVTRIYPVEIFTTNYDLLIEEALERSSVALFDGFVGTREPFFDLVAMEQDALPQRWTRLWKLHGSINWIKRKDGSVYRSHKPGTGEQVLIYPSHLKYDQSRRMPYLAMIDRLRTFFRESNSVLVLCGYSFADEHLNEVLIDGLRANRSAHCFALMYPQLSSCGTALDHAKKNPNLSVLAEDGAVIATRSAAYKPLDSSDMAGIEVTLGAGGASGPARSRFGDFHFFGLFLEQQFGLHLVA